MTNASPWMIISIAVLIVLLGIVAIIAIRSRKKPQKTDYYTFFIMGIIWFIIGLPTNNSALWMIGLIFMLVGLTHKKEWKANHKANRWENLSPFERKLKFCVIFILGLSVLAGLVVFHLVRKGVV